jgi:small-conductance mechanosensitive channel
MFALKIFDITLIGVNARSGKKLLFTLVLVVAVLALRWLALAAIRSVVHRRTEPAGFWSRQGIQLVVAITLILGIASIWIDAGTNLTTGLGLLSAGVAFALQQPLTAIAAYFVILRGDMFNVGDRIVLDNVRGDVIRLGFMKTTVLEMGQPPGAGRAADPSVWVHGRQYTGRIVTVSNGAIFSDPVFNYTRDFPFVWDELSIPITYDSDRAEVERIMLAAADTAAPRDAIPANAVEAMQRNYAVNDIDLEPHVYMRITDNWLELSLRFLLPVRSARQVKDAMTREILTALDAAGIGIASTTFDIVGLPPVRME